jgi:cyclopropane fatty-acyl-phospholipid synthase-like methyltransferase
MKPYSESCDQNREPILDVIAPLLQNKSKLLEIGSGTGQHAVYFGQRLPHLNWQTSDRTENHPGILQWLSESRLDNVKAPLALDVTDRWPVIDADAVFSANTAHIMHYPEVEALFSSVGALLPEEGLFILYGPFNYGNRYTSDSNARVDQLHLTNCPSGTRHTTIR